MPFGPLLQISGLIRLYKNFLGRLQKGSLKTLLWGISLCTFFPLQYQTLIRCFNRQKSSHKAPKTSLISAEVSTSSTSIPLSQFYRALLMEIKVFNYSIISYKEYVAFSKLVGEKCVCEYTHLQTQTMTSNQTGHLQSC